MSTFGPEGPLSWVLHIPPNPSWLQASTSHFLIHSHREAVPIPSGIIILWCHQAYLFSNIHTTLHFAFHFHTVVTFLQQMGAEVQDIEIPELEELRASHVVAIGTEFRVGMHEDYTEHISEMVMGMIVYKRMTDTGWGGYSEYFLKSPKGAYYPHDYDLLFNILRLKCFS